MGNYFEGILYLELNNKTPKNILDFLFFAANQYQYGKYYNESKDELIEKFKLESEFSILAEIEENCFINICSDYYRQYSQEEIDRMFNGEDSEEDNEKIDDYESFPKYLLELRFCTKNFDKEFVDKLIDFFRPYKSEDSENYLGTIKDENYTFRKEYYWDYTEFEKEQESRQFLCKDCKNFNSSSLCKCFSICKRAYDVGFKIAQSTKEEKLMKFKSDVENVYESVETTNPIPYPKINHQPIFVDKTAQAQMSGENLKTKFKLKEENDET